MKEPILMSKAYETNQTISEGEYAVICDLEVDEDLDEVEGGRMIVVNSKNTAIIKKVFNEANEEVELSVAETNRIADEIESRMYVL